MLLPLIGLVIGCVVFTIVGSIVFRYFVRLPFTRANLLLFIVGAFPGAAELGYLDGLVFADAQHFLNSPATVLGYIAAMLVGAIVGGTTLVWLKARITKRSDERK